MVPGAAFVPVCVLLHSTRAAGRFPGPGVSVSKDPVTLCVGLGLAKASGQRLCFLFSLLHGCRVHGSPHAQRQVQRRAMGGAGIAASAGTRGGQTRPDDGTAGGRPPWSNLAGAPAGAAGHMGHCACAYAAAASWRPPGDCSAARPAESRSTRPRTCTACMAVNLYNVLILLEKSKSGHHGVAACAKQSAAGGVHGQAHANEPQGLEPHTIQVRT